MITAFLIIFLFFSSCPALNIPGFLNPSTTCMTNVCSTGSARHLTTVPMTFEIGATGIPATGHSFSCTSSTTCDNDDCKAASDGLDLSTDDGRFERRYWFPVANGAGGTITAANSWKAHFLFNRPVYKFTWTGNGEWRTTYPATDKVVIKVNGQEIFVWDWNTNSLHNGHSYEQRMDDIPFRAIEFTATYDVTITFESDNNADSDISLVNFGADYLTFYYCATGPGNANPCPTNDLCPSFNSTCVETRYPGIIEGLGYSIDGPPSSTDAAFEYSFSRTAGPSYLRTTFLNALGSGDYGYCSNRRNASLTYPERLDLLENAATSPNFAYIQSSFLIRWFGLIKIPLTNTNWKFRLRADDGARLYIMNSSYGLGPTDTNPFPPPLDTASATSWQNTASLCTSAGSASATLSLTKDNYYGFVIELYNLNNNSAGATLEYSVGNSDWLIVDEAWIHSLPIWYSACDGTCAPTAKYQVFMDGGICKRCLHHHCPPGQYLNASACGSTNSGCTACTESDTCATSILPAMRDQVSCVMDETNDFLNAAGNADNFLCATCESETYLEVQYNNSVLFSANPVGVCRPCKCNPLYFVSTCTAFPPVVNCTRCSCSAGSRMLNPSINCPGTTFSNLDSSNTTQCEVCTCPVGQFANFTADCPGNLTDRPKCVACTSTFGNACATCNITACTLCLDGYWLNLTSGLCEAPTCPRQTGFLWTLYAGRQNQLCTSTTNCRLNSCLPTYLNSTGHCGDVLCNSTTHVCGLDADHRSTFTLLRNSTAPNPATRNEAYRINCKGDTPPTSGSFVVNPSFLRCIPKVAFGQPCYTKPWFDDIFAVCRETVCAPGLVCKATVPSAASTVPSVGGSIGGGIPVRKRSFDGLCQFA